MITYYNRSSQRYAEAAKVATEEGYRPGSGEWWQAIRYHMQYTVKRLSGDKT